jgi:tetratricopeptide (TPR) repeat protein
MLASGKDNIIRSKAKRSLADIIEILGDYKKAMKLLEQAEKLLPGNSIKERVEKGKIYTARCIIFRIRGDLDRAVKQGMKSARILKTLPRAHTSYRELLVKTYNSLGTAVWKRSEFDRAIGYYVECLKIAGEIKNKHWQDVVYCNLANVYEAKGDHKSSIVYYKKSIKLARDIGSKRGLSIALGNLGTALYDMNRYDEALKLFEHDLKISNEIGDKRGAGVAIGNIGNIYDAKNDFAKSIEYYRRYLNISKEIDFRLGITIASGNLGLAYKNQGRFKEAIKNLKLSLKMAKQIKDAQGIGIANYNLGYLFLTLKRYKTALFYLSDALRAYRKQKNHNELIRVYNTTAEVKAHLLKSSSKTKKQVIKQVLKIIKKALSLSQRIKSKVRMSESFLTYGKVYHLFGNIEKGIEHFEKSLMHARALKDKSTLAEFYFEYGSMLKSLEPGQLKMLNFRGNGNLYLKKSYNIYKKLNMIFKANQAKELLKKSSV